MPDVWGLASVAIKCALYLGVLTAAGTVLAAVLFRLTRYRRFTMVFALLGVVATLLGFSLAGAALTGDASGMTDPEMLGLLWSTAVGTALMLRLLGLGLLILGLYLGRLGTALSLAGAGLALWSLVHIGHVADRDSLRLTLVLVFHLAAISVWIGILAPLRMVTKQPGRTAYAVDLGRRFGTMAALFVPLLILAGVYLGYVLVGSFDGLIGTAYGQALLLKVVLVAALLAVAAMNKLRFIPAMAAGDQRAAAHLARAISLEWIVIGGILLTTATLTSVLTLPT